MSSSTTATLSASNPAETPVAPATTSATPEQAFGLAVAGVAAGLPVPRSVNIHHEYRTVTIYLVDDFPGGVWQWVNFLCLPAPAANREPMESDRRWFVAFESQVSRWGAGYAGLPGWAVRVLTFVTVEAPAAAEQVEAGAL